jgi:glycosyltransferase involved in cell wall biosynthesis
VLSVVIPAGGGVPRLKCALTCIASVLSSEIAAEVIVVNDGGGAEVRNCVDGCARENGTDYRLVEIPRQGRSAARNAGAARALGDRLLFSDADILLEKAALRFHSSLSANDKCFIYRGTIAHLPWLAAFEDPVTGELTAEAQRSLRVPAAHACLLSLRRLSLEALRNPELLRSMSRSTPFQRDLQRWFHENPHDITMSWIGCTGGQISIDRSIFEMLGGFDEQMGLRWGAEDLELGYRAAQTGIGIRYAEQARSYHMDHAVSGRTADHDWALAYFSRKHGNPGVMGLLDYFAGKCSLIEALEACHAPA